MSVPDPKKATEDLFSAAKDMVNEAKDGFLKEAAEKEVAEKTTQLAEEILTHTCSEITKQIGGKDGMIHEITKSIITDLREYLKTNDFSFKFLEVLQKKLLNEKTIQKPFLKKLVSSFNTIIDQSKEKWLERESSDNKTDPIVGGNDDNENSLSKTITGSKIITGRELGMNPLATTATHMKGTSPYLNGTENEVEGDTKGTENEVEDDAKGTENEVEDDAKGTENEVEDDAKGTENNTENARNASNPNGTINNTEYVGNLSNPNFSQMFDNDPKKRRAQMGQSTSEVHNKLDDAYQDPPPEPKSEEPINDQDDVKTLTQQLVDGLKEKIMEKEKNIVDHIKDVAQKTLIEKIYSDKFSFDFVEVLQTKLLNDSTQEEVLVDKFHEVYNAIMKKVVGKFNSKDSNNNKNSDMYDPYQKLEELQDENAKLQEQINEMKGTEGINEMKGTEGINEMKGTEGINEMKGTEGINEMKGTEGMKRTEENDTIVGGGKSKKSKKPKKTIRKRRKSRKKGKKTKRVRFL